MDTNKKHTNPGLFFFCVLVCALTGTFVTQPVAGPSPMKEAGVSDIPDEDVAALSVVEETDTDAAVESADTAETEADTSVQAEEEAEPVPEPEEPSTAPSPTEEPKETVVTYEVSPEAANGYWSKAEGSWFFVTDSGNYHGWLHDADGETYYLDPETGVMTTGLLELDGKTYYFNSDGVLMTGDTEINGLIYHLNADGSFDESVQAEPLPTPEVIITAAPYK